MRRRNTDASTGRDERPRGSDVRLRAALRRFQQTSDPADAAIFATEFLRTHGPPQPEPPGVAASMILAEYEEYIRETTRMIVDRLDVENGLVDRTELFDESLETAGDSVWARTGGSGRALETLLVSPSRFSGPVEGHTNITVTRNQIWDAGLLLERLPLAHPSPVRIGVSISEENVSRSPGGLICQLAMAAVYADISAEADRLLRERGLGGA